MLAPPNPLAPRTVKHEHEPLGPRTRKEDHEIRADLAKLGFPLQVSKRPFSSDYCLLYSNGQRAGLDIPLNGVPVDRSSLIPPPPEGMELWRLKQDYWDMIVARSSDAFKALQYALLSGRVFRYPMDKLPLPPESAQGCTHEAGLEALAFLKSLRANAKKELVELAALIDANSPQRIEEKAKADRQRRDVEEARALASRREAEIKAIRLED
jgi:hypothetical protein